MREEGPKNGMIESVSSRAPDQLGKQDAGLTSEATTAEALKRNLESHRLIRRISNLIEIVGGLVTSLTYRFEEEPPSAAWHLTLSGKRYLLILQPTDMPDAAEHRRREG